MKVLGRPVTKDRLINAYVIFNMRQGRGAGYIDRFRDLFILSSAVKIIFPWMTVAMIIPLGLAWLTATYMIGYIDEHYLKIWQIELEKNATWINPFNQRIDKRLKEIHGKVK